MTANQFTKTFCSLNRSEQLFLLTRLAADLTVEARGTYEAGTTHVLEPDRLRDFNEFQHRIAFHLLNLMKDDSERYPDDVFANIIWESAQALGVARALVQAIDYTEAVSGIQRGLDDEKRGRTKPVHRAFEEIRKKHRVPRNVQQ